jgi:hypothetical protein
MENLCSPAAYDRLVFPTYPLSLERHITSAATYLQEHLAIEGLTPDTLMEWKGALRSAPEGRLEAHCLET